MNTLKSIGAVVAGFLVVVLFSTGSDWLLGYVGMFPPIGGEVMTTWMLALALAYRLVYTVFGGYATALLAPHSAMKHVWVLAIIGQLGGIAGVVAGWNLSAHWYPIAIAVTAIPCVWLGGKLYKSATI